MAGINSCSPNANHDNGEKGNHIPSAFTNNGIHQCNYHIGRVQWRHCRKNISITPVDRIKDGYSEECIKATQSCNIAWCVFSFPFLWIRPFQSYTYCGFCWLLTVLCYYGKWDCPSYLETCAARRTHQKKPRHYPELFYPFFITTTSLHIRHWLQVP